MIIMKLKIQMIDIDINTHIYILYKIMKQKLKKNA